ncbi:hypothetical protein EJB05_48789, partial [Eragrostis curvula]
GLVHFQYNLGNATATAIAVYSSHNPGLQAVDFALFKSDLPSDVVEKITFVDVLVATMAKQALIVVLLLVPLLFLLPVSTLALAQDFCVANLLQSQTPSGYPCKPELLVTSNDFVNHGLAEPGLLIPPFKTRLASALVTQFPAVNGLGISATRFDVLPGGVVPMLTHPGATELLLVVEGQMIAGFVSADRNQVYIKALEKGDLFVFPQGLLHFQYNPANTTAVGFSAYSSSNPGLQIVDWALFKNNLASKIINNVTFIDFPEIRRLKALFGGSG